MEENTFLKEYNNQTQTINELKRKLGLNNHQYSKLYHEYNLQNRNIPKSNAKYTTQLKNGKITIRKWIGKNKEYLGCYATQEDADTVVETCKQHNWDLNNMEVQETIKKYRITTRNYKKINGRYYVYKSINKKRIYFDSFTTEEDAIKCVNFLKSIEWNKIVYDELKEEVGGCFI